MSEEMEGLNRNQQYFVDEFYEDYREGLLTRRQFIKRLAYIAGSMTATVTIMSTLGCSPDELPAATEPMPSPEAMSSPEPTSAAAGDAGTVQPAATSTTEPAPTPTPEPTSADQGGTEAVQPTATAPTEPVPVPGAQSPFSVPEGDPGLVTGQVTFNSGGDQINGYMARPAVAGTYPAVLVCHENRGLNDHIKDVTRRFAREGYTALAVDLLTREGGAENIDPDQVPGLLGGAGPERHTADFIAALDYLETLDFVDSQRIGMTGYCFGGGVTWQVATAEPRLKAVAPFYGPAPEMGQVPNIQAAVLGVYAGQDQRINASIEALEQALTEANITYQINVYPGVNHAFHNDTGQRYVEEQATQAWLDTLAWFETYV